MVSFTITRPTWMIFFLYCLFWWNWRSVWSIAHAHTIHYLFASSKYLLAHSFFRFSVKLGKVGFQFSLPCFFLPSDFFILVLVFEVDVRGDIKELIIDLHLINLLLLFFIFIRVKELVHLNYLFGPSFFGSFTLFETIFVWIRFHFLWGVC